MTRRWRVRSANRPTRRETGAPISRRRQPPPTHCGASRRNGRDLIIATRPAHPILPSHRVSGSGARIVSRPGASAFSVSDGPISSNSGRNGGKNAGRNCVSALPQRAMADSDFLRILAGIAFCRRCRIKGLCLRSPARRLTRPLAQPRQAFFTPTAIPQNLPLEWRTPSSLPPGGAAVLNDTPVACQTREPTDPQGDRCPHIPAALAATYPLRCFAPQWARFDNRHSISAPTPTLTAVSGSGASGTSDPPNRQRPPPHFMRECIPPNLYDPQRAKGP